MRNRHIHSAAFCTVWVFVCMAAWPAEAPKGDIYTLDTCPVSGEKLGTKGEPVVKVYQGREFRFCCPACPAKFEANPEEYIKKVDAAVVAEQKGRYPLDTCVVLGTKLEEGKTIDYVYKNRLVRFCCQGCIAEFEKDPAKYLAKLDAAVIAKQKAKYPLTTCVVTGNALGEGAVDYVTANRLIRFCCPDCIKTFEKDPQKYLLKLQSAEKAAARS